MRSGCAIDSAVSCARPWRRLPAVAKPTGGAPALLQSLREHPVWRPAIATGSWPEAAQIKLAAGGLNIDGLPAAYADDAVSREAILAASLQRATEREGSPFGQAVYVGDGVWDARAAQARGLPSSALDPRRGRRSS
ncbi:MAG: HAD family hydrolase [Gemmatimonadetes bacterium]|nr:HAD family hydrolase [Gemmatimonadota bacterium]